MAFRVAVNREADGQAKRPNKTYKTNRENELNVGRNMEMLRMVHVFCGWDDVGIGLRDR